MKIVLCGLSFILGILFFGLSGCENAKHPYITYSCDSKKKATYTSLVKPILDMNCKPCHQPGGSASGKDLSTYTGAKKAATDYKLLESVQWTGGVQPMPQGGYQLPSAQVSIIQCWIDQGMAE
jgi:hypothetical protein